ncbi:MAG TPA: T9SS type A sorting domain-containing protein [Bacteroidia bacterium]|nr:T9SS type A sorting domain-containing protein [Bacteroidia bacterium]HNT79699.1 T9SS type A sorting domain-containing protein [Bacteroidia bacterium]
MKNRILAFFFLCIVAFVFGKEYANHITKNVRNTITYNVGAAPSLSAPHSGIWLQNSHGAMVVSNSISNDAPATGLTDFRGIDVVSSTSCQINCNVIDKISRAVYFTGDCNFTKMRLNEFKNYEHAIELFDNNTLLSEQGEIDPATNLYMAYDNEWTDGTSSVYRTFRNSVIQPTLFNWYYDGAPNHDPTPTNTVNPNSLNVINCTCSCTTANRETERGETMLRLINDSILFEENPEEVAYTAKLSVFNAMQADSAIIYQNKADDYLYEGFYTAMKNGNMGLLDTVKALSADSTTIQAALALNAAIYDTNFVETWLKTVNYIYLGSVASGVSISSADSALLNYISDLPLKETGPAKFMAAALLGKEVHEEPSMAALRNSGVINSKDIPKKTDEKIIPVVFPNPAISRVYITGASITLLEIHDAYGRICLSKRNVQNADIEKLSSGFYTITLWEGNKILHKEKLAIIR